MAVNYRRAHLVVLSEDDATRSVAVGFSDQITGPMELRKPAGGWPSVLSEFIEKYVAHLTKYADAHVLMVIDFDDQFASRLAHFQANIPQAVASRVYILGAETEAEKLKNVGRSRVSFQAVGEKLAAECREQQHEHWASPQLAINQPELARLNANVRPFLI